MKPKTETPKEVAQPPLVRPLEYWEDPCACGFRAKTPEEWQRHSIVYQGCGGGSGKKFNRLRGSEEMPSLRLFRAWGGCEHHANLHTAYAESADAFVELIRLEHGNKYPLSEPEEMATAPNAQVELPAPYQKS